jgi:hypothetical protein
MENLDRVWCRPREIVACHGAVLELWNLSHRKTVWEFGKSAEKQTNKQVLLHAAASGTECNSLARGKKMNGTLHQIAHCVCICGRR